MMPDSLKLSSGAAFVLKYADLAAVPFVPENTHLGDYVFVPHVRNGLSAAISAQPSGNRVKIRAEVDVADSANPATRENVARDLTLYGPGDVTGIDPAAIIRREPAAGTSDAEEGYLAHVEFGRPDLPWLFSPVPAAGTDLRPWIVLIVCEASVSHLEPSRGELPGQIWTRKGQLQSLADAHRYAHAQVVGAALDGDAPLLRGPAEGSVETRLSDDHAPANLSRLLCPRRLDDGVDYIAALVPAFDCGVKAGLGMPGGTLAPAWTRGGNDALDDIALPVYDAWTFRTAKGGDFKALAERIQPVGAPWAVGRRFIDLSKPGSGVPELAIEQAGAIQVLECALFSPALNGPAAPPPWPVAQREAVRLRIDAANADKPELPRVGARLYARYQRAATQIGKVFGVAPFAGGAAMADADWFAALNTDPKHRIVAGLGARVVQKDQEQLMQAAWAQVDGIRKANQIIAWAGLAERVNLSLDRRHLETLDAGRLMQVTRNIHTRIRDGGQPRSVAAAVVFSRTADVTLGAAFRRTMRAFGPVARRQGLAADAQGKMVANRAGFLDHRVSYRNPDGIDAVSGTGLKFLSPDLLARVLQVARGQAQATFVRRMKALSTSGPAVGVLGKAVWRKPVKERPGAALGQQLLSTLKQQIPVAAGPQTDAGTTMLGQVLTGLANVGGNLAAPATSALGDVVRILPQPDLRPVVRPSDVVLRPLDGGALRPVNSGGLSSLEGVGLRPFDGGAVAQPGLGIRRRAMPLNTRSVRPVGPVVTDITLAEVRAVPDVSPTVRFESGLSRDLTKAILTLDALGPNAFALQARAIISDIRLPPRPDTDLGPLTVTKPGVLAQIEPRITARLALKGRITGRPGFYDPAWFDSGLRPIMAAPVFKRAMYEALADYDRDWLAPGLGQIARRDFITLLSINPGFAEAFLVGASDEMGRELLWRDYPTDQRGTYFRRFWDADEDELTRPIHLFSRQPVGRNFSIGGNAASGAGALALVIRGELLRRFPDTSVFAMRATGPAINAPPTFIAGSEARILFSAHLPPDFTIVGFDLTVARVLGPENWWFVLAQNPTAPRFGLATNPSPATDHGNLDWADFGTIPPGGFLTTNRSLNISDPDSHPTSVQWPGHAGVTARTLLVSPIRAAFRGSDLIQTLTSPN
jgi:hypothetical protein